jgi:predicted RNase H-like HicB family nuclease
MRLPVHIQHSAAPRGVRVFCPDLPGCSATAPTVEEALERLVRRIDEYFAASRRHAPAGTRVVTIEV